MTFLNNKNLMFHRKRQWYERVLETSKAVFHFFFFDSQNLFIPEFFFLQQSE